MQTPVFLDANASAPVLPGARAALLRALGVPGNPSSPHALGRAARRVLDEARDAVAMALGAVPKEVTFTSGASEANRWVVDAITASSAHRGAPLRVWCSPLEHPSMEKPLQAAHARGGLALVMGTLHEGALALPDDFREFDVVIVTAAHNETGVLPDLARICGRVPAGVVVVSDASQAVARIALAPARVDVLVASAHKIGGVAGAGALVVRGAGRALRAPWTGGGQEGGLRPGTEALALHAAFGAAAAVVERSRAAHAELAASRDALEAALRGSLDVRVLGASQPRLPNTSAFVISGVSGDALRLALDRAGVCVGFGSACSALAPEPSPALLAMGLTAEEARATVRVSLAQPSADATPLAAGADLDDGVRRIIEVVRSLRHRGAARARGQRGE